MSSNGIGGHLERLKASIAKSVEHKKSQKKLARKYTATPRKAMEFLTGIVHQRRLYRRFMRSAYGWDLRRQQLRRREPPAPTPVDTLEKLPELIDVYLAIDSCYSEALRAYRQAIGDGKSQDEGAIIAVKAIFSYDEELPPRLVRRAIFNRAVSNVMEEADVLAVAGWIRTRLRLADNRKRFKQAIGVRSSDQGQESSLLEKLSTAVTLAIGAADVESEVTVTGRKLVADTAHEIEKDRQVHHYAEDILEKSQTSLQVALGREVFSDVQPSVVQAAKTLEEREILIQAVRDVARGEHLSKKEHDLFMLMYFEPDASRDDLAIALDVAVGTIDSMRSRIRAKFKHILK